MFGGGSYVLLSVLYSATKTLETPLNAPQSYSTSLYDLKNKHIVQLLPFWQFQLKNDNTGKVEFTEELLRWIVLDCTAASW